MTEPGDPRRTAAVLWLLLAAFALRVAGQMLVAFAGVDWLPPMSEWMSGLMPYPYLLPAQLSIIVVLACACVDLSRGRGFFATPRSIFARPLLVFGYLYFGAMVLRYVLRMILVPEARWFGGTIPIFFHLVLATYLIVFARWHRARLEARPG